MRGLTAALLLLVPVSLSAQRYDDTVTVNVVEVPVYVERFGVPVAGLTRDDFELFVNAEPQPIEYFDVVENGMENNVARPSGRSSSSSGDLKRRRLIVLLFDMSGSSAYGLHRARKMAVELVAQSPAGDAYAVATIARTGVRFVVPFTTDRVAVTRAIGTLAPSKAADPFGVATLEVERSAWGDGGGGRASFPDFSDGSRAMREWDREERFRDERLFADDLADLADQLAPLSGIKHVVLLTERPGSPDPFHVIDPAERVHERFRAAGVILDGVDVRLSRVPGGTASEARSAAGPPDLLLSGFLYSITGPTGGTVDASLCGLQERNRFTYILGFQPSPASQKKTNSIRVRLKNRPLFTEVRYRQSYTLGEPDPKKDWLFLADTLLNDIPQLGVTLDLEVKGTSVVATIPGVELLSYANDAPLLLDVYLYVFDEQGQPAAWKRVRLAVDLAKGRDFLNAHPYTVRQDFELPPGRYSAKAIVRVVGTDKTGFAREDFVAPQLGNGSAPVSQYSVH